MEKQYTIQMEDRAGYLRILVGGEELTAQISAAYWNEIAERCAATGCERVLIEKKFKRSVSPEQMILMADHLSKVLPHGRVAFIDRYRHDAINELGKKLARNRDVMFQVFEDLVDAERWLLAN